MSLKIKNFTDLAVNNSRKAILEIAETGLEAIDTQKVVKEAIRLEGDNLIIKNQVFSLKNINQIFVVGAGKCSLEAAGALEDILGEKIFSGIIIDIHRGELKKIKTYSGDHPMPTEKNVAFAKEMVELLKNLKENDLVIALISGGGSTLLCLPGDVTCQEESKVLECLFKVGAPIQEINTIRKHLSFARGGFLSQYAYPAKVVALIFSDVPGDDINFIASGPTVLDRTFIQDAEKILNKYNINALCGIESKNLIETPKDSKYFEKVSNILLVSNKTALEAMFLKAKNLGFNAKILKTDFSGEASLLGKVVIEDLNQNQAKTVLLYGGESTVTIKGNGKGGRNQELALSSLKFLKENQTLLTLASDGRDNTDYAGAICDIITNNKAHTLKLNLDDYLKNNDSYNFFTKIGDYLLTGETGSNVSDLIVAANS